MNKAMFWGLITALALMILNTIYYSTDNMFSESLGYLSFVTYIAGIVLATLSYRKSIDQNTPFPYSKALGLGVATMFFSSIIMALFIFILYKFIDVGLIDKMITFYEDSLLKSGMKEDMVDQQMMLVKKFLTPALMSLSQVFSLVIYGFIISLITSIFLRKKPENGFDAAMSEIDNEE